MKVTFDIHPIITDEMIARPEDAAEMMLRGAKATLTNALKAAAVFRGEDFLSPNPLPQITLNGLDYTITINPQEKA